LAENIRLRVEKAARRDAASEVSIAHVEPFMPDTGPSSPDSHNDDDKHLVVWSAASLARLQRIPEAFRAKARSEIEDYARKIGAREISGDVEEGGFAAARRLMCPEPDASERPNGEH
jgi:hypothetical protein